MTTVEGIGNRARVDVFTIERAREVSPPLLRERVSSGHAVRLRHSYGARGVLRAADDGFAFVQSR
jgi:hypothetical protein